METTKTPRVSILLPTYNRAALLERAIKSVQSQQFTDWELIVVNDASTDTTRALLERLSAADSRIRVVHNATNLYPDISFILNKAAGLARGQYFARLDDDDYWVDATKLTKQVEFLDAHSDCAIVGTGVVVVDGVGKELFRYTKKESDAAIRKIALCANPFSHTTVLFRADVFKAIGGYGPWRYAEDWDLWLRMGVGHTMYNIPEFMTAYTLSQSNKSFLHQRPQARVILRLIKAHRRSYPRYWLGFLVHVAQLLYAHLPIAFRTHAHRLLSRLKRSLF